jgi:hypothetical protein
MTKWLAWIVAMEAVLCAVLGAAVLGREGAPDVDRVADVRAPATPPAAVTAAASADAALAQASAVASQPAATSSARQAARAKYQSDDLLGVMLTGTVRWRDGTPVGGASLWAARDKQNVRGEGGPDGAFAMLRLTPGEWQLTVRADGAVDHAQALVVTDDAEQTLDVTLDRSFPVRVLAVTADGKDLTTVLRTELGLSDSLVAAGQSHAFPERFAPTDYGVVFVGDAKWHGEMNPKDGLLGTLRLAAAPPAHVALLLRHVVLDQQRVEPGHGEVRFVVAPDAVKKLLGSATVRVVDATTQQPIAGARVGLATSNRFGGGQPVDDDGRARVENLSPGLMRLTIDAKDHEALQTTVRIEPGATLDLGTIALDKALPLAGRVVDAAGKPATAEVRWTELKWRTTPTEFVTNRGARVEADGTFSLWGTGPGRIAVSAHAPDGRVAVGVFDNPPAQPVVLQLQPGCALKITRPKDPSRTFTVTVFGPGRQPVAAITLEREHPAMLSLPAGRHAFEVHDDTGRLTQSGDVDLGAGGATLEVR